MARRRSWPSSSRGRPSSPTSAKSREPQVVAKEIPVVEGDAEQARLEEQKHALDEALAKAARESHELAELKDQVIIQVTDAGVSIQVVEVGGHTDSRPFAPQAGITNWELAFVHANNARKVLETNGLREDQIKRVISYADSEPLAPENPLADENRRLSILAERQNPAPAKTEPGIEAPIVQPAYVPPAASPSG